MIEFLLYALLFTAWMGLWFYVAAKDYPSLLDSPRIDHLVKKYEMLKEVDAWEAKYQDRYLAATWAMTKRAFLGLALLAFFLFVLMPIGPLVAIIHGRREEAERSNRPPNSRT